MRGLENQRKGKHQKHPRKRRRQGSQAESKRLAVVVAANSNTYGGWRGVIWRRECTST